MVPALRRRADWLTRGSVIATLALFIGGNAFAARADRANRRATCLRSLAGMGQVIGVPSAAMVENSE